MKRLKISTETMCFFISKAPFMRPKKSYRDKRSNEIGSI